MQLRPYQTDLINRTRVALRSHRNALIQAPTGSGKTVLASYMLDRVRQNRVRGFFICHRRELIDQTAATFQKAGIDHGYIATGYPYNEHHGIYIASIDTLKNRLERVPAPGFVIWDEAHHLGAAGWARVHACYADAYHVGLSATPHRLDGKGLGDQFGVIVPGPRVDWLIDNGYLAKYKLYSVPVDMSGVHTLAGEFNKKESAEVMNTRKITGDIIAHWQKYADGRITLGFAVNIAHSEHIVASFQAAGIGAAHLDGNTPKDERRRILAELAAGRVQIVFNVGLFGEGFDIAANSGRDVTVGCVIDAAPTKSLGAWLQRCGRALRPQSQAIILDHAGNAMRHGLPCEPREWSLAGNPGQGRDKGENIAGRQCPECFLFHKPAPQCPECGHIYAPDPREVEHVAGELQEIAQNAARRARNAEQGQARTLEALIDLGRKKGVQAPERWARHIIASRERKDQLRRELINLVAAAQQMNADAIKYITQKQIMELKPKALEANISAYKAAIEMAGAA